MSIHSVVHQHKFDFTKEKKKGALYDILVHDVIEEKLSHQWKMRRKLLKLYFRKIYKSSLSRRISLGLIIRVGMILKIANENV